MFEKLIEVLVLLVAALNENSKAIRESSGQTTVVGPAVENEKPKRQTKADKAAETPASTAVPGVTVQDLRTAAQAVLDANNQDAGPLAALAKEFGAKRITEVAVEKHAELLGRLQKLAADSKAGAVV